MEPARNASAVAGAVNGHGLVMPPRHDPRPLGMAYARFLTTTSQTFMALGDRVPEAHRETHRRIAAVVLRAFARNPRATLQCFGSPTVSTPIHCLGLRDDLPAFSARIDAEAVQMLAHVLFELAIRQLLPDGESILWLAPAGSEVKLSSPALGGTLAGPAGTVGLRFSPSHLVAIGASEGIGGELARLALDAPSLQAAARGEAAGFSFSPGYFRAGKVTRFGLVDHNPIAEFEAHPDKQGNHLDLGERDAAEWVKTLDESFDLVEKYTPGVFAEMGMMMHVVLPVGYHRERHLSASYREAIGTVYLTLHPNVMTMAEALIHEFQHNKINCASYGADFLHNAFHPRYPSPVRPDPRPLWGILLAVHAFLPVAQLYRGMRDAGHPWSTKPDWLRRMSEIDLKNHEGMEMLRAHAEWTPAGRACFGELEALERAHMAERAAAGLSDRPTDIHLA